MILQKVEVKNFRLLSDIEMQLEELATVVVGRNNSGKTSLYEVLRRFLDDRTRGFLIEDFSTACHCKFFDAAMAHTAREGDEAVRNHLPAITLRLSFQYNPDIADFGALAPLIVDLDPDSDQAVAVLQYALRDGRISEFFADVPQTLKKEDDRNAFFRDLRERVPTHYAINMWAEDPNDPSNTRVLQPSDLSSLLDTGFINAQRGLDNGKRLRLRKSKARRLSRSSRLSIGSRARSTRWRKRAIRSSRCSGRTNSSERDTARPHPLILEPFPII